jgi:Cu-Zn family superoxide dismutase
VQSDEQGTATLDVTDNLISLNGLRSVIGRGLVIHAGTDDLGTGGNADSLATGNAGARSGCGIIGEFTLLRRFALQI